VNDDSPGGTNDRSPKESQIEESHIEESKNIDLDCLATNRKKRDSRPDVVSRCKQYPRLRELIATYMMCGPNDERVLPSDRHVVDIVDAADGGTEDEIIQCLRYLYNERGLEPATRNGPRQFSWFPTVVGDYFRQKRERQDAANPLGYAAWEQRNEERLS
jgi:hypothetical protein